MKCTELTYEHELCSSCLQALQMDVVQTENNRQEGAVPGLSRLCLGV